MIRCYSPGKSRFRLSAPFSVFHYSVLAAKAAKPESPLSVTRSVPVSLCPLPSTSPLRLYAFLLLSRSITYYKCISSSFSPSSSSSFYSPFPQFFPNPPSNRAPPPLPPRPTPVPPSFPILFTPTSRSLSSLLSFRPTPSLS
jgi:hypothetical protein